MSSTTKKSLIVLALVLICFIPTVFVMAIINDREMRHKEVRAEIGEEWGNPQEFLGPVLVVPFKKPEVVEGKVTEHQRYLYIFPGEEKLNLSLLPTEKVRGIFRIPVYQASIVGDGKFTIPSLETLAEYGRGYEWGKAIVAFPITDVRSIDPGSIATLDGAPLTFSQNSGLLGQTGAILQGVHAKVNITGKRTLAVTFDMTMNGNERISFVPGGSVTSASASSPWNSPSFSGAYLPTVSSVEDDGFTAEWRISGLGRSFPQVSTSDTFSEVDLRQSLSTVTLFDGINQYVMVMRAIKYAILFIGLTFMGFFFVEVLGRLRVHPIQYALVGAALALFYLLLLSLSEQIPFIAAYTTGAGLTTLLISTYSYFVLKAKKYAVIVGLLLASLYSYLYLVLRSEDYALLSGTLLLFGILAVTMYITRKVDWYGFDRERGNEKI